VYYHSVNTRSCLCMLELYPSIFNTEFLAAAQKTPECFSLRTCSLVCCITPFSLSNLFETGTSCISFLFLSNYFVLGLSSCTAAVE